MLEISKVPSLAIVRSVVRNNLNKPMNKGSVYAFISPNLEQMCRTVNDYTSAKAQHRFNIFAIRTAYHPNTAYFFMNAACRRRIINYRKPFAGEIKSNIPQLSIVKMDSEQLNGMNVIDFTSAMPAEVAKDYNRENKPEILWVYILKEFRKAFRLPTVYSKEDDPGVKPFDEANSYKNAYMIFDLTKFDIPKVSELNVARSAKYPDILRNFLYFLQYESAKYSYLLPGINFLFVSPTGTIKYKLNDQLAIAEAASDFDTFTSEDYRRHVVTRYSGKTVMDIIEASNEVTSGNAFITKSVRTLTVLLNKIVLPPETIDPEVEKEVLEIDPIVIDSTAETEAQDAELTKVLKVNDSTIQNLPEEKVEELSTELMNLDNATGESTQTMAVKAILDAVEQSRQERVSRLSTPKQMYAVNKMYSSKVVVKGKEDKLMDVLTNPVDMSVPKVHIPIHSEQGYDENSFMKFTDAYNEKLLVPHIVKAASAFKDASVPVFVEDISITDTSDKFNEVNTVSTKFMDEDGNRFTVTVDIPKMYKGNRIKIGSSEMVVIGQLTYLPILKVGDDVIITTNHNKIFMEKKYGNGLTPQGNKMLRALDKMVSSKETDYIEVGDFSAANKLSSSMSEEMKELSTRIGCIDNRPIQSRGTTDNTHDSDAFIFFKASLIDTLNTDNDDQNYMNIGMVGKEYIKLNLETSRVYCPSLEIDHETLYSAILKISDTYKLGITPYYESIKTVNKLTSTYIKLMNEWVPLIYVLMYTDGLHSILERTNTKYEIISSEDSQRRVDKDKEIKIELKDATLYIDIESVPTSLLYYPLSMQDLTMYTFSDLESIGGTAEVLSTVAGNNLTFPVNMSVYKDCFIDPFTKDILESLNQPTDFTGVMLYANNLLSSPETMEELSLNSCRIRYAEMIQAIYYKELSNAYADYSIKKRRGAKNAKMSISKNRICQAIIELPNTEVYSKINPYMEGIKRWSCNYKGHMGKNLPRSYTWESRSYHSSYVGSIGLPTAFSANIGINKQFTIDPMIDNLSGMFKVTDDVESLKSKQIITSTEAITTGSATRSDAPRDAMNQAQKSAIIAINQMDTAYYTNSYDAALPYMSDDFVIKGTGPGVVEKITDRYVLIKYNDGSKSAVKLRRIYKNSAKGKYVTCHMNSAVKLGQKINKDTIIAHDANFFKNTPTGIVATMGAMVNVLWKSESLNYEDSIVISESAAKMFMVKAVKRVACKIPCNAKILSHLKLDDYTNAETELITYVKGSDDSFLTEFLDKATLSELDKKSKKAHKSGIISNVNVTYACDPSSFSPSVKKFVETIKKDILELQEEAILLQSTDEFEKRENTDLPQEVTAPHKLNGDTIEKNDVLIEFFIEYYDFTGRGDKGSQTTALKGIVAQVRPDHLMPVGVLSGRRYDVISSQYSPGARKTFDVNVDMLANAYMEKENQTARDLFL